jgi:hypothetical protein
MVKYVCFLTESAGPIRNARYIHLLTVYYFLVSGSARINVFAHAFAFRQNAIFEKLGSLDFDLSMSPKIKCRGRILLSMFDFILVGNSNSGSISYRLDTCTQWTDGQTDARTLV